MNDLMVFIHTTRENVLVKHGRSDVLRPVAGSPVKQKAATTSTSMYSELWERLSVRGRFKRQPHIKLCAIGTRAEVDFSVMPFDDDPVTDNQAESRA